MRLPLSFRMRVAGGPRRVTMRNALRLRSERSASRFLAMTAVGFGGTLVLTLLVMAVGFYTFGAQH